MKKINIFLFCIAMLPVMLQAQADDKLKAAANEGDTKSMILLGRCYETGAGVEVDSAQAVQWFQRAAKRGDGDAWIELSTYYLEGVHLPADTAQYLSIRKEWAGKGLPSGLAALGRAYMNGYGTEVDSVKALELFQQAASKGSGSAYYMLASAYSMGLFGLPQDEKMFLKYAELAWEKKDYDVASLLAVHYFDKGESKKGWKYIDEAMKWGDVFSKMIAAESYFYGMNGVKEDERKALQIAEEAVTAVRTEITLDCAGLFFMSATDTALVDTAKGLNYWLTGAEKGYESCQLHLAQYYMNMAEYGKAYMYLQQVEQGSNAHLAGEACMYLANLHENGLGVAADIEAAKQWFGKGVTKYHNHTCALMLAMIYENEGDMASAIQYYTLADTYGSPDALIFMGMMYADTDNYKDASDCFEKAIDKGFTEGYYWMAKLTGKTEYLEAGHKKGDPLCTELLGTLYAEGSMGKPDYQKAKSYYLESGNNSSLYHLGLLYLDGKLGKLTEKETKLGMDYMQKAADNGYIDAIYFLGYCYQTGAFMDSADHVKAVEHFRILADNGVAAGQFKMGVYYEVGRGGVEADATKAVEYYQKAAAQDHAEAICYLADFYRTGNNLPLDKNKAFEYYSKAHNLGEAVGTYYVGRCYLEGCGVEIDSTAAIAYLQQAASQGVGDASYLLAEFYNYGLASIEPNADSAIAYYIKAHENGNSDASYYIGLQLLNEGMHEAAVNYFAQAANRHHPEAIVKYALCLLQGVGTEPQPAEAVELLLYAANNFDNAEAYENLGVAYLQGIGVVEDEMMGKAYIDTAAQMGRVQAQFYLALCYMNGWGCTVDSNIAILQLEKAAGQGYIRAMNTLGDIYESRHEYKTAVKYYQQAVELGSLEGYCNMGWCYQEGLGVLLNSQKAFEYYKVAADNGYVRGMLFVAECYLNSIYVEKNVPEALAWLEKAAQSGSTIAMYHLGAIYAEGDEGVEANVKTAKSWFEKAAGLGYAPAEVALERLSKK